MEVLRNLLGGRKSFRAKDGAPHMRSIVYDKDGLVDFASDIKMPVLEPSQVLVKVHCAALNRVDLEGKQQSEPTGVEFVGTIWKLGWRAGDRVHMYPFAIGDVVLGMCEAGALSDFVKAEASKISFKPDAMTDEQAAAFSLSGLTAFQALQFNKFGPGKTIAVIGPSNATGAMFARQARLSGAAKVILIDNADKEEYAGDIGCDAFYVAAPGEFDAAVEPGECDLIIDALTDPREKDSVPFEELSRPLLAKGGKFVAVHANPLDMLRKMIATAIGLNVQRRGFDTVLVDPRRTELKQLADWFEEGKLMPVVDSTIDVTDIAAINAAYARIKAGDTRGKIVVRVAPQPRD